MVFVGMLVAASIVVAIVCYCFPRWFKTYMDYYWSKQGGVSSEDKSIKEPNKESSNTS